MNTLFKLTILSLILVHGTNAVKKHNSCSIDDTDSSWVGMPGIHSCLRGHRCVYEIGGNVSPDSGSPGFHTHIPFITKIHQVKVTWDTDNLDGIECGSKKGGSKAYLDIRIINRLKNDNDCVIPVFKEFGPFYDNKLIYDYIPTEVAQFCKQFTMDEIKVGKYDQLDEILMEKLNKNIKSYNLEKCIEIKAVHIDPPRLEKKMQEKFAEIEIEGKEKELEAKKKETEQVRQEAQLAKEKMELERKIQQSHGRAAQQEIANQAETNKTKAAADAELYLKTKQAEGNNVLHTEAFVKMAGYKASHANAKLIFGQVPQNALINMGSVPDEIAKYMNTTH